jgi:predicted aspartyl protease
MRKGLCLAAAALAWLAGAPSDAACKMGQLGDLKPIIEHSRIYVPGKADGKDVLFMVDTGADTLLFADAAQALGISVGGFSGETYGATGHATADGRATLSSLQIGMWSGQGVTLRASGSLGGENYDGVPVIGVLGEDILSHFDVEIDVRGGHFSLYQMTGCEDSNLAYWTDAYNVVDIERYEQFQKHIRLYGMLNDRRVSMILDTGAPFTAVSFETARTLGLTPGGPGVEEADKASGIHGEAQASWIGSFASFTLDQERIAPARIRFFKFAQAEAEIGTRLGRHAFDLDMFLGFDFIRAHRILISHSQRKLYFSYSGGTPFSLPKPKDSNPTQ